MTIDIGTLGGAPADRLREVRDALFGQQVLPMRNQHDAVPRGNAEQRDKADDGGHR